MKTIKKQLTTLAGNFFPGKYLTFSCVSLIISVNFLPSINSSNTYIVTRSSKFDKRAAFAPTIFAIAEPLEKKEKWKKKKLNTQYTYRSSKQYA